MANGPSLPKQGKKRKITAKRAKMRAWQALSKYIRDRDKRCMTCSVGKPDHCGHYQRNGERSQQLGGNALWYDERNFLAQCAGCNLFANGRPVEAALVLRKKYGEGILEEINTLYRTYRKWTVVELLEIETFYLIQALHPVDNSIEK